MQKTGYETSPPARREALRFSVAALAAGVVAPAFAAASTAATSSRDAERIALCAFVVEQDMAQRALHAGRHTLADERRTEPALQASYAASAQALDRLASLPGPFTLVGVRAMARAAMALAPRDWEGEIMASGDAEWLAFGVADFLAKAGAVRRSALAHPPRDSPHRAASLDSPHADRQLPLGCSAGEPAS